MESPEAMNTLEKRMEVLKEEASRVAFMISQARQEMLAAREAGASQDTDAAKHTRSNDLEVICQHPLLNALLLAVDWSNLKAN